MNIPIYQVDAFASEIFQGNPAAVCPLDDWLPDDLLQSIAMENNLSETAFFVKTKDRFEIRWFTPAAEVDLCGHATLATSFILFNELGYANDRIDFFSPRSGALPVDRINDRIYLNFPTDPVREIDLTREILECFNIRATSAFMGKTDYLIVFESEEDIKRLQPDFLKLSKLEARGVIVCAPGEEADFVSRFFAPGVGINEDPVTGSAHTTLTPFWAERLGKLDLEARQLSTRGGEIHCKMLGDRVELGGEGRLYMKGEIHI